MSLAIAMSHNMDTFCSCLVFLSNNLFVHYQLYSDDESQMNRVDTKSIVNSHMKIENNFLFVLQTNHSKFLVLFDMIFVLQIILQFFIQLMAATFVVYHVCG